LLAGPPEEKTTLNDGYRFTLTQSLDFCNDLSNCPRKMYHNYRRLRQWPGMVPPSPAKPMTASTQLGWLNLFHLGEGTMPIFQEKIPRTTAHDCGSVGDAVCRHK